MNSLSFKNVSVVYGEGTPFRKVALENINIDFPTGEIIGIIGHTGSGKSTLAMLSNGLLKPTSGNIFLENTDIWEKPKEIGKVRSKVGIAFQYPEYQLFEETVFKDIAFGPKNMGLSEEEINERVKNAAKFCGIDDASLKKSPFELSGGQKRRAAIAGVVAMDPQVLVLDEPAAGLDPLGREEILGGLISYQKQKGSTMILISHSMEDIAKYCDRILVLKEGGVFMYGTVGEIFMQAELLFGASLDLPQITKLFIELKKRGLTENTDVYTVRYAKKEIEKFLQ
ncbi:MAG: energy-coupling factor transporter ATPase [Clostridiales bacterium GWF2_36_10]|nr:MAG: energy-coupling factor transporter ATPase [Clostridiales bacterium GWF2_36_10]HAN21455.1 energy-coupling factor transporter ATPase [Clostridiales bacterium]